MSILEPDNRVLDGHTHQNNTQLRQEVFGYGSNGDPLSGARVPRRIGEKHRHSNGIWNRNTTANFDGGQLMQFKITNQNAVGTTIRITDTKWKSSKGGIILPRASLTLEFSAMSCEPMTWTFDVSTESDVFLVRWELYSTWVPGDPPTC